MMKLHVASPSGEGAIQLISPDHRFSLVRPADAYCSRVASGFQTLDKVLRTRESPRRIFSFDLCKGPDIKNRTKFTTTEACLPKAHRFSDVRLGAPCGFAFSVDRERRHEARTSAFKFSASKAVLVSAIYPPPRLWPNCGRPKAIREAFCS
jgi:hypothetical protein